jgi:CubicO group peptidase (beta-lactamase class C family)
MIEKLGDAPFREVFRQRTLLPLGIEDSVLRPEEFLKYRSAVGHVQHGGSDMTEVADPLVGELNHLPAGTLVSMSARSLAAFGRMIVDRGVGPDGDRVVSETGLQEMERPLTGVVPEVSRSHVWECENLDGARLLSHFGGTCGQNSWLGVVPEHRLVVAVLTNFFSGAFNVLREVVPWILREKTGLDLPGHVAESPGVPPDVDLDPLVGGYKRFAMDVEITRDAEGLKILVEDHEHELDLGPDARYPLKPLDESTFLIEGQQLLPTEDLTVQFFSWDDWPSPVLVYFGRAHVKEPT